MNKNYGTYTEYANGYKYTACKLNSDIDNKWTMVISAEDTGTILYAGPFVASSTEEAIDYVKEYIELDRM